MGLFTKVREFTGSVSDELLTHGLLGRGQITSVQQTSVSVGSDMDPHPVCVFTVDVMLDNVAPFTTSCRQSVPLAVVPQLPDAVVAVRVDPKDHNTIALSLGEEPPTVTVSADRPNTSSAAELLMTGEPARAVIIASQPLGMRNAAGVDIYAFVLTILMEGRQPYQVQVGNPVPASAVPLLYPGSNVPAKVRPSVPNEAVIDWDAALAEFTRGPA